MRIDKLGCLLGWHCLHFVGTEEPKTELTHNGAVTEVNNVWKMRCCVCLTVRTQLMPWYSKPTDGWPTETESI